MADQQFQDLIPASMIGAYAFCPRLCFLQFVQGESQESAELAEDRRLPLRWADAGQDEAQEDCKPLSISTRSVFLSAPQEGVCCRIDLLEGEAKDEGKSEGKVERNAEGKGNCNNKCVTPVEYGRGKAHACPSGWYDPQIIKLAAQGLVLQENGFSCDHGMIYHVLSKERVFVPFDPALMTKA